MAAITGVNPRVTPTTDEVALTITGDGFTNATYVYFEDSTNTKVTASAFKIVDDKQITTVIPSLAPGPVYVFVIIGGTESTVAGRVLGRSDLPVNCIECGGRTFPF